MNVEDSSTAHSGVPVRLGQTIGTPTVYQGTLAAEDGELWTAIKARWSEVEKLLADRQALVGILAGTPGHTQKKTYVFNTQHIALIDQYAQEHRLDLKDVIFAMCQEFFQRRGYLEEGRQ